MFESYEQGIKNLKEGFKIEASDFIDASRGFFSKDEADDLKKSLTEVFMMCEEFSYDRNDIKSDLSRVMRGENPYDIIFNKDNKLTAKFFNKFLKKSTVKENVDSYISHVSSVIEVYKRQEQKIIEEGKEIRSRKGIFVPDFMEGKEVKVLSVPSINSAGKSLMLELSFLNERINGSKRLKIANKEGRDFISYGENYMKPVSFFERRKKLISSVKGNIDSNDKALLQVIEKGNFKDFKQFLKSRKEEGANTVNKELSKVLEDEFIFNHLSFEYSKSKDLGNLVSSMERIYGTISKKLEAETSKRLELSKKDDLSIDMLIFSNAPRDIARMSNYSSNIESCMSPKRKNVVMLANHDDEFMEPKKIKERLSEGYLNLGKEIGAGTIVVFGVNSANPLKKLTRVSLKPYENANGDVLFKVGKDYGISISGFKETVEDIVKEDINKGNLQGLFVLKDGVYSDNEPEMIVKAEGKVLFKDILSAMRIPHKIDKDENISVKGDVDFGKIAVDLDKIVYPDKVKINGMASFGHRKDLSIIPKEIEAKGYNIFGCDNFRYVRPDTPDDAFFMITPEVVKRYKNNYKNDFMNNAKFPRNTNNR